MAWTAFVKTDDPGNMFQDPVSQMQDTINSAVTEVRIATALLLFEISNTSAPLNDFHYFHDTAPTEPGSDGSITTTDHTGLTPVEYTANGDPPGYVKSFTTETGIFSSDQMFDEHSTTWRMRVGIKRTGTIPSGETAFMKAEIYKRNAGNSDTLLFSGQVAIPTRYAPNGSLINLIPAGSVLTTDRLRVRFFAFSEQIT